MAFTGYFKLLSSPPRITSPNLIAKTGDTIYISGKNFKYNINQISGRNIYDSSLDFYYYSGLNNTSTENVVSFTIPQEITPSNYGIYLYNNSGISENFINLKIIGAPSFSGLDKISGTSSDYIRISGANFYPLTNFQLINNSGVRYTPEQDTGLYSISSILADEAGTGYQIGTRYSLTGKKLFNSTSSGVFEITSTGISGSLYEISIINSGLFTVIDESVPLRYNIPLSNSNTTETGTISIFYDKYENTGNIQFIEFKVPKNINGLHSGIIENLRFKNDEATIFTGFNAVGVPIIYGFEPLTGNVDEQIVTLSGKNFSFVNKVFLGAKEVSFNKFNDTGINFLIPNLSETDYITISGSFGVDKSDQILNVNYPNIFASGFYPNDILLGTGSVISISGKYLQRINYIDLENSKILRPDITINSNGTSATFTLPNNFKTSEVKIFSLDFANTGFLIRSSNTDNKLIASTKLDEKNINFRYLSGVEAAKYLDEIEFFTSNTVSGDYGNLSGVDIFFLSSTGNKFITGDYSISGIKVQESATGLKIKIPREIKNPQCPIKIKRNKFGDEYILSSTKQIDVLPTIYNYKNNITTSNTGELIISGINATNVNQIFFSGNNLKDAFGFKNLSHGEVEILSKNINQITGFTSGNLTGYTVFSAKLGGNYVGGGSLFLFNNYYDSGIGYETLNINPISFLAARISGFRPKDSDIFTSEKSINVSLDRPFTYNIKTNTNCNIFEVYPSNEFGADNQLGDLLNRLNIGHNGQNIISGVPVSGGNYYFKIRTLNGDRIDEGMLLQVNINATSGRQVDIPGIIYQGDWKSDFRYIGDASRRDVVFYDLGLTSGTSGTQSGSKYWYAAKNNIGIPPATTGSGSAFWIQFSNEFNATATKILLAEESNITNSLNIGKGGTFSGFIKSVNDVNANTGSGFFLGYDNSYNSGLAKFRVGNDDNYIKFDGIGLDIVGPLSGVITTSRNVKNTYNQVKSNYSVVVGFNNLIETGSDNSMVIGSNNTILQDNQSTFIFGENNQATGSQRAAISAGSKNIITGTKDYISFDSNILGGRENFVFGSYSNIVGGKNNYIDSVGSGYNSISDYLFDDVITGLSGSGIFNKTISYIKPRTDNNLSILTSLELKGVDIDASGLIFRERYSADTFGTIKRQSILNLKISGITSKDYSLYYDNPISFDTGVFSGIASGTISGVVNGYGNVILQSGISLSGAGTGQGLLAGTLTGSGLYNIGTGYYYQNYSYSVPVLNSLYDTGILSSTTTGLSGVYSFIDIVTGTGSDINSTRDKYGYPIGNINSGLIGKILNSGGFRTARISGLIDTAQYISGNGPIGINYTLPRSNDFAQGFQTEFVGYYTGFIGTTNKNSGIYLYFYTPENDIPTGNSGNAAGLGYVINFSPRDSKVSIYWADSQTPLVQSSALGELNNVGQTINNWPLTGKVVFQTGKFDVYLNRFGIGDMGYQQVITGYIDPLFTTRNKSNRGFGYGSFGNSVSTSTAAIRDIKFNVGTRNLIKETGVFKGLISPFYCETDGPLDVYSSSARINYNLGTTGVFDKFSGEFYTNNKDVSSFYWLAKGTVFPNTSPSTGDSYPQIYSSNPPDWDGYQMILDPIQQNISLYWGKDQISSLSRSQISLWDKISFVGNYYNTNYFPPVVSLDVYENDNFLGTLFDVYTGFPSLPPRLLSYDYYSFATIPGINANSRNLGINVEKSFVNAINQSSAVRKNSIRDFKFSGWSPALGGTSFKTINDLNQNQNMPTGTLHVSTGVGLNSDFNYDYLYMNTMTSGLITGRESRFISGPGQITAFSSGILDVNNLYYTNSLGTRTFQKTPFVTGIKRLYNFDTSVTYTTHELITTAKHVIIPLDKNKDFVNDVVSNNNSSYSISAWLYPQAPLVANQKNAKDTTGNFASTQIFISFNEGELENTYPNESVPGTNSFGLFAGIVETSGYKDVVYPGVFQTGAYNRISYGGDSLTTLANYALVTNPGVTTPAPDPYINTGAFLFGSYNGWDQTYDLNKKNNYGYVDDYFYYPYLDINYVFSEESGRAFTTGANSAVGERAFSTLDNFISRPTYGVSSKMTLTPNNWNHVVYSHESLPTAAKYRYYINGNLVASGYKSYIGKQAQPINPEIDFIILGGTILKSGGDTDTTKNTLKRILCNTFNGYIGELRIDDYAVTGLRYNVPTSLSDSESAIFYINGAEKGYKLKEKNKEYVFSPTTGFLKVQDSFNQVFYTGVFYENVFNLDSWSNVPLENLYSGSFERNTGVGSNTSPLQFNIYKTGVSKFITSTWNEGQAIVFPNKFNKNVDPNFNLICLYNIFGTGDYSGNYYTTGFQVSGLSDTGFYLFSNQRLDHTITGNFYIGQTGIFTGIDINNKFFEINSIRLSGSRSDLIGDNFILSGSGLIPITRNMPQKNPVRIFGNVYCESGSSNDKQIVDYYNFIYTTGTPYYISFYTNQLNQTGWASSNAFSTSTRNVFWFTGSSGSQGYSGQSGQSGSGIINILRSNNSHFIDFNFTATNNSVGFSGPVILNFTTTLFKSGISDSTFLPITEKTYSLGYGTQTLSFTGLFAANSGDKILLSGQKSTQLIIYPNYLKIIGESILNNTGSFYIKLSPSGLKTKQFLTDDLKSKNQKLTGLRFDYIITDLEVNYLSLKKVLGESTFGRISSIGFDDVGSSSIFGGTGNYIKGLVNTIGGGIQNKIIGDYNVIPGGRSNIIIDEPATNIPPQVYFSTILGGNFNKISGNIVDGVILGGENNLMINNAREANRELIASSIIGGKNNLVSGSYSTIIGGTDNVISGNYSYNLGRNIINNTSGSIVIGDGTITGKRSLNRNALTLHFNSGIYITGVGAGTAPIIFDLNSIPSWDGSTPPAPVPIGGIYRNASSLQIRLS